MELIAAGSTDVGLVRRENQDSYLILPQERLFAVADGMGGHAGGGQASRIAVEVLETCLKGQKQIDRAAVDEALALANAQILDTARKKRMKGMGTTLVLAYLDEDAGLWQVNHIGDSRAYVMGPGGNIYALTRDHSLVGELLAQGSITAQEAKNHPHRHILTRALGMVGGPGGEWSQVPAAEVSRLLLCTDGLYNMIETEEILKLSGQAGRTAAERAAALVEAAKAGGGLDNITVILIEEEERA